MCHSEKADKYRLKSTFRRWQKSNVFIYLSGQKQGGPITKVVKTDINGYVTIHTLNFV